jgi:hypothetical protein
MKKDIFRVNSFLPIMDNWQDYFYNPYEGLGTSYERFILHNLFKDIDTEFSIESVLETPSFGMTGISGINSVWWSGQGKKVVISDNNKKRIEFIKNTWINLNYPVLPILSENQILPYKNGSIDLLWNFAALWFLQDLSGFAELAKKIAKKVIFICVPNNLGIGYQIRKKLLNIPDRINLDFIKPKVIRNCFAGNGWELWKQGLFDVPPWPDIPMKKEDLLEKFHLGFLLKTKTEKSNMDQNSSPVSILDFYGNKKPEMEEEVLRYDFLEKFPHLFKLVWGHHRYFVFRRMQ